MQQFTLENGWQLKQRDLSRPLKEDFLAADGWLSASVPGTVHQALLDAGRIPDPFVGLNENEVQWVADADWLYHCTFDVPSALRDSENIVLCLDGLDTFAEVWLNGEKILTSDNMFIPQRVTVKSKLKPEQNQLYIVLDSAVRRGAEREKTYGKMSPWGVGSTSRLWVRKAQFHYGWDWGPTLITSGPWRAVRLEAYNARLAEINCPVDVAADLSSASLPVTVSVESGVPDGLNAHVALYDPAGKLVTETDAAVKGSTANAAFNVTKPQLWWPNGYGAQPLYRLVVRLTRAGQTLDEQEMKLGLRRLRLVQEPLTSDPGTSFTFEINHTPIFCGGANWIPADSFNPRVTPEEYRAWVQLAADSNMVMLRIWGGGIYEEDVFYDLCDELGVMIWQDFMFACGLYPAADWFLSSVKTEAEVAVRRLRHHPSIVLWCGNNEDYQTAEFMHVYDQTFNGDFTKSSFPAREIYERLLPKVCAALDPTRPYWPGSPYGGEKTVNDQTVGDRHAWDVWHGSPMPGDYHDYPKFEGRFVSEFGMQALPSPETIESFTKPEERQPYSRVLEHHNKMIRGPERLGIYITGNVPVPTDLKGTIYASQFVQAEAVSNAYLGWRRRWGKAGQRAVSGALVWQLDDCWPVTSWAIVDSELRTKPAYYVIRRLLAPFAVGLAKADAGVAVWAINGTTTPLEADLELKAWTLGGKLLNRSQKHIALPANEVTELGVTSLESSQPTIVSARLLRNGSTLARTALWPEPFKYYKLPYPGIEVSRIDIDTLQLQSICPAKGVWLSVPGQRIDWGDNMIDLMPGDPQVITAKGLGRADVQVQSLDQFFL